MNNKRLLAGALGTVLAGSLSLALSPPVSAAPSHQALTVHGAAGRVVNARTAAPVSAHTYDHAPLLRNGAYSGSGLSRAVRVGAKAAPAAAVSPQARVTSSNFTGLVQSGSGCVCGPIPEANSAVGPNNIVEVVSAEMSVYSKTGTPQFSVALNTLLGTTNALGFPRIIYDPLWNRWVMSVEGFAPTTADYGQIWTLVSTTADPTATWYVISQNVFWAGLSGLADFPTIGMDRDSLILSSNNYSYDSGTATYSYASTTAYAIPKAIIYNSSNAWTSSVFFAAFGTVPAIVTGKPTPDVAKVFMIATDPDANAVHVYSLVNAAHFGRQVFRALPDAPYSFDPPSRRVHQPGTAVTLDPGDGRISWAPSQVGARVWFAHSADYVGYPSVRWGYVTTSASPTARTASAFHNGTSDDFNPALAVVNDVSGRPNVFLTWAYTDTPNSIPVHDTWDSKVGAAVVLRTGTGYSPTPGSSTTTGDMGTVASVAVDYSRLCGLSAVVTGQYFSPSGGWRTRIAEVGSC